MSLLGEANWWLPAWLDRALPRLHVEEPHPDPAVPDQPVERLTTGATA